MKRFFFFLLLGVFALTVQTTLLRLFPVQKVRPDFLLIFTLYFGFSTAPFSGALLSFLLGILVDLFSGNTFGLYAFSRPLLFYIAFLFKSRFYLEGYTAQVVFIFSLGFLEGFLGLLFMTLFHSEPLFHLYPSFLLALLPQSVFTALVTPALFALFQRGSDYISPQEAGGLQERK